MPYKSEAQRKYFNANREKLEAEGVDVDEWNESSKGKKLPEKAEKKAFAPDTSFADDYDETQLREALAERVRMIAQLRAHRDSLLDAQSGYMPEKRAYGYSDDYGYIERVPWLGIQNKAEVLERMAKAQKLAKKQKLDLTYESSRWGEERLSPEDAYKMVEALPDSAFTGEFGYGGTDDTVPWSVSSSTRDGSKYNFRKDPLGIYDHLYGGDDDHEYDEYGNSNIPDEPPEYDDNGQWFANPEEAKNSTLRIEEPKKSWLGTLFGKKAHMLDKQANYSVVQNMAWMSAQEKIAHEKQANKYKALWSAVKPFLKGQAAQTGVGAGAGAISSPFMADMAGIETGAGRAGHLASSMAVGAGLGNPSLRKHLFSRKPWGRAGQAKAEQEALKAFSKVNPNIKSTEELINAFNKSTGGKPQRAFAPVKGTLMASSLAAAPTAIGAYMDPTKRFAEKMNEAIAKSEAGEDFKSPSQFLANIGSAMAKEYGFDKEWVENVGKELGITAGSGLLGGGIGSLVGGKLADMVSDVAIDPGNADYDKMDEAAYKKRRRKEKLKTFLGHAGSLGGGLAGSTLGAVYLPDLLKKYFNVKKGNDMNPEIRRLAQLTAMQKQAGIRMNPEAKKRLMGGLAGGGIGAGIGAVGTLALDPIMDKLFKSPEEQMREKARTTLAERIKARLIAGAAVGGGVGIARGSGMKDLFQKT